MWKCNEGAGLYVKTTHRAVKRRPDRNVAGRRMTNDCAALYGSELAARGGETAAQTRRNRILLTKRYTAVREEIVHTHATNIIENALEATAARQPGRSVGKTDR